MPQSPGTSLWVGPDGGPFTVVGSSNPLPVTANSGTGTFVVGGAAGAGSPPSGNPVYIAGTDSTNVRGILTDTSGRVVSAPAGPATNGLLTVQLTGVAGTGSTIKNSSGVLYGLNLVGVDTANDMFVQLFNALTGSVTLGTTVPVLEFFIPKYTAGSTVEQMINQFFPWGIPFSTAITVFSSTTDGGATGSAANKVRVNALYI